VEEVIQKSTEVLRMIGGLPTVIYMEKEKLAVRVADQTRIHSTQ